MTDEQFKNDWRLIAEGDYANLTSLALPCAKRDQSQRVSRRKG